MGWGLGHNVVVVEGGLSPSPLPQELLSRGATLSSWYHLCLPEGRALPVFCDMDTLGGGWLVSIREETQARPSGHFCPLAPRGRQNPSGDLKSEKASQTR